MKKMAVIGAGISGLTVARLMKDKYAVTVLEKESTPGGLIRCRRVEGNLFHLCGGHVFNSHKEKVLQFFWKLFDRDREFAKADRNSVVFMNQGRHIPYPIENHAYLFDAPMMDNFINDLIDLARNEEKEKPRNFEEFLRARFGNTLYEAYFRPYNEKVWRRDLKQVPLSWLEGKLPMPTVKEIIYNNINHVKEKEFVHSTFWYEKHDGSQWIANRLAEGLHITYGTEATAIERNGEAFLVNGETFDKVVFCGNIKQLPAMLKGTLHEAIIPYAASIKALESHGTTAVFCEIDPNPYSWIYMPGKEHDSHRIICTGNFAPSNNAPGRMTATIEFTDFIAKEDILDNLSRIPLHPRYLDHHFSPCTYPIQDAGTRQLISSLKKEPTLAGFHLTGRFADWEYYNMDVAMDAAMKLCREL